MEKPRSAHQVAKLVRDQVVEMASRGLPITPKDLQEMYRKAGGNPQSAHAFRNQLRISGGFKESTGVDLTWRQRGNRSVYFDVNNPPSEEQITKSLR